MSVVFKPDPSPDLRGGFFVSAIRGENSYALLLGPYDSHSEALERVPAATSYVTERVPDAHWWSFGTCRVSADTTRKGALNGLL